MSNIRLTYTGVKYFILQIIAYLIGIAFPIYVARTISVSDYGVYGFIAGLWVTFDVFKGMIPFWAGRMIAREGRFVKTAFISNLILSIPLLIIYLISTTYFSIITKTYILVYLVSSLYIPISYATQGINAYIQMKQTDKLGYGPLISSFTKISIGLLLVYYIGLLGAVLTLITAYFLIFLYFYSLARKDFEENIDIKRVKEWIKGSWYVLATSIATILYANITILLLGFLGKTTSLGSYYVAIKISSWITLTTGLSIALGPRLLSEVGGGEDVQRTIDIILLFATPMLIGIFSIGKGIIYLFGGWKYMDALIPLFILAIAKYMDVFSSLGITTVFGFEKLDKKFEIKIRELFKSDMFKILIYRYIVLITLAISIIALYPLYKLVGLALATLIASGVLFILIFKISYRKLGISRKNAEKLMKYVSSSVIMGIVIYFIPKYRSLLIIATVFLGMVIYFSVLYVIDKEFRILVRKGKKEITRILIGAFT